MEEYTECRVAGVEGQVSARQKMIEAVFELLLTDGFEGLSIRKVAAAVGVSIGAVQHHFPSKNALLTASVDHVSAAAVDELEQALSTTDDPTERLRAVCMTLAGATDEGTTASKVYLLWLARAVTDREVAERHRRDWQQVENLLSRLITDATGVTTDDSREASALLLATLDGLAYGAATEPGRLPAERLERLVARAVDAAVAG